jgi:peptide/nickel transport system ATP-binding protein
MTILLSIRGLKVTFSTSHGPLEALRGVDLDICAGQRVALMGESGCGKSVLGHAILGLLHEVAKVEGEITFNGKDIDSFSPMEWQSCRGLKMALIPQSPSMAFDPVMRVGNQIAEMFRHAQKPHDQLHKLSVGVLGQVGFEEPERIFRAYPHQLSGGMCERSLIAMGISLGPDLLIADEPTKGLDHCSKDEILGLLSKQIEGRALLMITHDFHAARTCERTVVMYAGEVFESGPTEIVLKNPLHPYVHGLVHAQPSYGMTPIPGTLTRNRVAESGCQFRNRCPLSDNDCNEDQPLRQMGPGHHVRCHNA